MLIFYLSEDDVMLIKSQVVVDNAVSPNYLDTILIRLPEFWMWNCLLVLISFMRIRDNISEAVCKVIW